MRVDSGQFLEDGFLVLREVVPAAQLEGLRAGFETLVERQREVWARERAPEDPPGGAWETSAQPRLVFQTLVDRETADTVAFCLHGNTLGVSRQLMQAPEAAVTAMFFMCSPVRDHGPSNWHRDIHPIDQAPLCGLQQDLLANAPGYLQWNIPLYDDDVLWVVPGSHRRPNTDAENRILGENPRRPLPGGVPVSLRAGDGVVYTNTILHWGSNYSAKRRRTIHLGYRSFGGPVFPYVHHFYWDLDFTRDLPGETAATFARFAALHQEERGRIESLFRAILRKDAAAFGEELSRLHPGEPGRMVCVVLLSKLAHKLRMLKRRDVAVLPPGERARAILEHPTSLYLFEALAERFSEAETELLWQRFAALDARLQSESEQFVPGFQSRPMRYRFEAMPEAFAVDDFIASWDA
jgi:ectoine hydroxylase-related dioxygenase (phytanoyl-CoA dioxygenase family)